MYAWDLCRICTYSTLVIASLINYVIISDREKKRKRTRIRIEKVTIKSIYSGIALYIYMYVRVLKKR